MEHTKMEHAKLKDTKLEDLPSDIIMSIALLLDLPEILKLCQVSKRLNEVVCDNEIFWMRKTFKDYPNKSIYRPKDMLWKNYYKQLSAGKLFMFGDNEYGQLGDGTNTNRNIPTYIPTLGNSVKMVSCGDYHTGVMTNDNELFMFGYNNIGQLGDGTNIDRNIPTYIPTLINDVKTVSCGHLYTGVVVM